MRSGSKLLTAIRAKRNVTPAGIPDAGSAAGESRATAPTARLPTAVSRGNPAEPGPAAGWRALLARRPVPFLAVVLLSAISPAFGGNLPRDATWWGIAWGFIVAMVIVGWVGERRPELPWLSTIAPLLLFPAVAALRAANGDAMAGFSPLLFLPVVWFAMYGVQREVLLALAAAVLTLVLPILIIGGPGYPAASARGTALLLLVLVAVGPLMHRLVESGRRSAAALAMSEVQFRAAFDDAPAGMALTGLVGEDRMRFFRVNRALCLMLGRSPEELTSLPIVAFTHPDDIARSEEFFAGATQPDTPTRLEKRYLHSSGRVVWVVVSYSLVRDDAGRPMHLVCQIEDVSAQRESQQAMLDALETERTAIEKLRELERSRVELLGTVSHDLRTPITAAAGFAELLGDGEAGPLTEEQQNMLATVSRNIDRIAQIVDDLLALARAEAGAEEAPAVVDIKEVLDGAVQTVRLEADLRGLALFCHNGLDGAKVSGDAGRLERVLVNLVGNAVKFTPDYGAVHIAGEVVGHDVVIDVIDTGIGIPLEDQEQIFERFYRSPHAREHAIAGTGLGLSIVRAIADQHGGTVKVRSAPGEGATFTLTLPLLRD